MVAIRLTCGVEAIFGLHSRDTKLAMHFRTFLLMLDNDACYNLNEDLIQLLASIVC
jgi:hypothetical protein